MIHQSCGGEVHVELETHNSRTGTAPTALYFECLGCGEAYRWDP